MAIFANVVFEENGNQSVKNFTQGLLLRGYEVVFLTVHPGEGDYMRQFIASFPRLRMVNLLAGKTATRIALGGGGRLWKNVKEFVKRNFVYKKLQSNSRVIQWFSLLNTISTLRLAGKYIERNHELLRDCDQYIFIDVFGGLLSRYLKTLQKSLWREISGKTTGYYLGTVLSQFKGNNLLSFLVMPLTFCGSYKVPHAKLLITDDGTQGEDVFRKYMRYPNRILFLRNGIDEKLEKLTLTVNKVGSARESKVHFVACSRLVSWKRVDRIIRFVCHVKNMMSVGIELTIIGDGEERDSLVRLVSTLGMSDFVRFTGGLQYDAAISEIASKDYYILFNDLSNLGNQIYESIILRVVPLTIDDGSTDALLTHGVNSMKFGKSVNFEENAARMFASMHSKATHAQMREALGHTQKILYTWRERNKLESDFMFG